MKNTKLLTFLVAGFVLAGLVTSCQSKSGKTAETAEAADETGMEEGALNTLTQEEIDEGWLLMFDGETTDGWRGWNRESFPDSGWNIEEGALHCLETGTGEAGMGGDIIYDRKFQNFKFRFDWKIGEGGNSGVFYLAQEIPDWQMWKTAPEMQILDNERHIDAELGKNGNRQAGSLYDLIPADPQNAKPAGEWNTGEIMVYDGTVIHKMNGEVVVEYHLWTDDWYEMIKDSKFPDLNPDWGDVASEGYIGLQDHGHDVWYRNLKIKEL